MDNVIAIESLSFGYGRKHLFSGLSLSIETERIYGLLGRNGSGKTTLLNLISGLLFARQGSVQTVGENPGKRTARLLSQIFFLPEQIYLPSISASQYLDLHKPFYPDFDREAFDRYADAMDIGAPKKLQQLSHGQQKKFMLAFGLAANCPVNLLDEPTSGLDIPSKSAFRRIVAGAVDHNKCFVISTHQVRDVEHLIDSVIVLDNGKVVFDQTLEKITDTLSMEQRRALPDEDTLYSNDDGLGSYSVVKKNTTGKPCTVDLELLFNAILHDSKQVQTAFYDGSQENV